MDKSFHIPSYKEACGKLDYVTLPAFQAAVRRFYIQDYDYSTPSIRAATKPSLIRSEKKKIAEIQAKAATYVFNFANRKQDALENNRTELDKTSLSQDEYRALFDYIQIKYLDDAAAEIDIFEYSDVMTYGMN